MEENQPAPESQDNPAKRKKVFLFAAMCFVLLAAVVGLYWLFVWRFEEYTNDAYVHGNQVELTPQVPGIIAAIYTDNTRYVEAGQVLVALDPTDYVLALEKSQADLAETVRRVDQMFIAVKELEAEVQGKEASLLRAQQDFDNRVELAPIGAVAQEEFEHVETALLRAEADLAAAEFALEKGYAQVSNTTLPTHPLVQQAREEVRRAWVNLRRCNIIAPVSGYIAERSAQLGEFVPTSKPLLAIIPVNDLWVDANFKETQLPKMRIGQPTRLTADLYGHRVEFHGKVVGINPGTGNVFSALPPQNATGNWIKIVQRVPVRISLAPKELEKHPLWLGLSMNVSVDISDQRGAMLATTVETKPLYATSLYEEQVRGADRVIDKIIEENTTAP